MITRLSNDQDLPAIADLRWRLQTEDDEDDDAREAFVPEFLGNDLHTDDLFHFVSEVDGAVVGVMSVRKVWKIPAPGRPEAAWGYIANSYVLPNHRGSGAGAALLKFIEGWARDENLELLVVWPSTLAYPFYERAGYKRYEDPLVLKLED